PRMQSSAVKLGIAITYRHTPERHARRLPTAATDESIRALNTGGQHAPGNEPTVRAARGAGRGAARDRRDRAGAGGDRCGHRRARYLSAEPRVRDRAAEPGSRGAARGVLGTKRRGAGGRDPGGERAQGGEGGAGSG